MPRTMLNLRIEIRLEHRLVPQKLTLEKPFRFILKKRYDIYFLLSRLSNKE